MRFPQALPARRVDLVTEEAGELSAAQPERRRQYVQIRAGRFEGTLTERSDGVLALAREHWGAALRVRCARPPGYVVFSAVASDAEATWCGIPLGPRSVIELGRDWEIATGGALEAVSFAVARDALEQTERLLSGGEEEPRSENRLVAPAVAHADALRQRIASALLASELAPAGREALRNEFLELAARLRRAAAPAHVASGSRRRAAVRRVEEFLDAHEREVPSLAELCSVAGVSERTLEYAFQEQLGLPPGRVLRLRRLNQVRRELRAGDPGTTRVADVAMRWGFRQLGRFAADYRALFGERPSETVARATRRRR